MKTLFHFLGGIHLAIILIASALLFVIAGTFFEAWSDSHLFAAKLTYKNPLFTTLLWLFFINILFAALRRYPFQAKHIPFLITHLGLLMILGGTLVKSHFGVQGMMGLAEGSGSSFLFLPNTSALQLESREAHYLIPLQKNALGNISTPFPELELTLIDWAPHSEESFPDWESEMVVICDKGYGGYALYSPEEDVYKPLVRQCKEAPPPRKWEERTPRIRLLASDGTKSEIIPLAYDRFATRFKWPILGGKYLIRFQSKLLPIPHHVRLREARQINYANTAQPYSFESDVLIDDKEATISMNRVHQTADGFRFYMANLVKSPYSAAQAQIVVNGDPAKYFLTYPGGVILALGIFLLYLRRNRHA